MIQELRFLKWDDDLTLQELIASVNKDGWRVVNINYIAGTYEVLVEKEAPPPVLFTMPPESSAEEIERFSKELTYQHEHGALQHHSPLMVTGNVQITRLADKGIQYVEITREMLDSWFGPKTDPELEANIKLMDEIREKVSKGEITVHQARELLGIPTSGVDNPFSM